MTREMVMRAFLRWMASSSVSRWGGVALVEEEEVGGIVL